MKKTILLIVTLIIGVTNVEAQTIKTEVLVLGNGNAAWAAGLQAAVSGVQATILLPKTDFNVALPESNLHSGIGEELSRRLLADKRGDVNALLKTWADSTANLKVIRNNNYIKISRSGSTWNVRLANGQTLKARVLINAAAQDVTALERQSTPAFQPFTLENTQYRTSIASGDYLPAQQNNLSFLTLSQIQVPEEENYLELKTLTQSLSAGQAAGAVAAYASFFKTKTSETNLKAVQGELFNYKQALIPLADVGVADTNWRAMQTISLMGVMKPDLSSGKALFHPEKVASFDEVEKSLQGFYYKANIWFEDHRNSLPDLDNTISLICYVGNKSVDQVKKEVTKKWKATYKFKSESTDGKSLSRREFAVLLHDYLPLLDIKIDAAGKIIK